MMLAKHSISDDVIMLTLTILEIISVVDWICQKWQQCVLSQIWIIFPLSLWDEVVFGD